MTDENEKPLSALVYYQPIEPADIGEIEKKKTPELVASLSRELIALGLGLEELSRRVVKAPREGRRRMAPVNGRQGTIDGTIQMGLF